MIKVLADISSGNTDWADVFFLIGVILFIVAAVCHLVRENLDRIAYALLCFGLASVALGWLVL